MQPLTHQLWAKHFVSLRPRVLEEWPDIDPIELESARDDWDHLVQIVQRTSGLSADLVQQRLRTLDVEDLNIGPGSPAEEPDDTAASLDKLVLGRGFEEAERQRIVQRLAKLNRRLKRFPADATHLELQVKERNNSGQTVTFLAQLPGFAQLVATSSENDLRDALMDVREDMWRQIDDAVSRRTEGAR
jgi:ribosome-associated translation inhibitor RaiA